ncbi:methyl-accepting chemotaxis sensory transducer [Striga asiatica]|uniref:Methyl-accepting chemotaxis sensory transducer n=1 Tax=Striga asiatica TaxID=4170 RepID=A0A5A7P419_STRAF|nr:methyl-accepting chemotaxis sensory transducer [Striga asiatica]
MDDDGDGDGDSDAGSDEMRDLGSLRGQLGKKGAAVLIPCDGGELNRKDRHEAIASSAPIDAMNPATCIQKWVLRLMISVCAGQLPGAVSGEVWALHKIAEAGGDLPTGVRDRWGKKLAIKFSLIVEKSQCFDSDVLVD